MQDYQVAQLGKDSWSQSQDTAPWILATSVSLLSEYELKTEVVHL